MASLQVLVLLSAVALSTALPALQYPIHASCKITWKFSESCTAVSEALVNAAEAMEGSTGCDGGGEKCLYTVKSHTQNSISLVHETPQKHYKDDLTITLSGSGSSCSVQGVSTSETWYAYLDSGTNYCNLHNLITKAALDKVAGYSESTSDSSCTQYSSADCDKY